MSDMPGQHELSRVEAHIETYKQRLSELYAKRRAIVAEIKAAEREAQGLDPLPRRSVSTERVILAISRGSGQSVKAAAAELGVSTDLIYSRLNSLCEEMANEATRGEHGPSPNLSDPRSDSWYQAKYRELARCKKSFGLRVPARTRYFGFKVSLE